MMNNSAMQVQRINEFSQVKTRVCDTYCSHHCHALGISRNREREKSKYVLNTREDLFNTIIDHFHIQLN